MIRRLSFNPADPEHRRCYELGHVLIVTDAEKRSRTEEDKLVDLQDDWESHGHRVGDEKVSGAGDFIAHRHIIKDDDEKFDLYLEDAAFDLLKKIVTEAPVSGHVRRFRRPLIAFVEGAAKGKMNGEGEFQEKEDKKKPELVKAEDRATSRPAAARKRPAAEVEE